MGCQWKSDWKTVQKRYDAWWKGEGLVVSLWGNGIPDPDLAGAGTSASAHSTAADWYDPAAFAASERRALSQKRFPLDIVPFVYTDYGTVSLAPMLGSPVNFGQDTVWYGPSGLTPENDHTLAFDETNPFCRNLVRVVEESKRLAGNDYFVGAPALAPGLDVLAELRGTAELMMDMAMDGDWVHAKLREIQTVSYAAIDRLYPLLRDDEGRMFHSFFMFGAPGTSALAQCDTAAMISPAMFAEFCVPYLREYCDRYDRVLYHVDGPDALRTVDMVLEVEGLDAVEFTPGPQLPQGGDPSFYDLYRKIKKAGKSVEAVWIKDENDTVERLLDAVGPEGMYLEIEIDSLKAADKIERIVERYRKPS